MYEFGVFRGGSMRFLHTLSAFSKSKLWGFDSFEGLPDQPNETKNWSIWRAGDYAADVREELLQSLGGSSRVGFVKGFYNVSLAKGEKLRRSLGMRPAKYVDIDVDLYSSTLYALKFLFEAHLIRKGTVVGFDDYNSLMCDIHMHKKVSDPLAAGEGRAHAEVAAAYGARFICLAGSCLTPRAGLRCQANNPIFIVSSMNDPRGGDTGFHLTPKQYAKWRENDPACRAFGKRPNPVFVDRFRRVKAAYKRRKALFAMAG